MKISSLTLLHSRIDLTTPYELSFTNVEHVDSIVVHITMDNGSIGLGEAVPLPGYSTETRKTLIHDISKAAPNLINLTADEVPEHCSKHLPASPFARSAICVAAEMAAGGIDLSNPIDLPLVAPLASSASPDEILERAEKHIHHGYKTLKLKVGRNIEEDLISISTLFQGVMKDIKIRIDANQAYSEPEARRVLELLDDMETSALEVFEQPFGIDDWEMFASLARQFPSLPLMLDESIFDLRDVEHAFATGAHLIKLKLYKHRGTKELLELATRANELGMGVVLGNGVATGLGNLIEASLYKTKLFTGAFEGNGYEKLVTSNLLYPVTTRSGNMQWHAPEYLQAGDILNDTRYCTLDAWQA